jgi:hypothetical protein
MRQRQRKGGEWWIKMYASPEEMQGAIGAITWKIWN